MTRVLFPKDTEGLPPDELTIPEVLAARGYVSACIGKWHLGHHPEHLPRAQGFDSYFGVPYSNDMDKVEGADRNLDRAWRERDFSPWNVPLLMNEEEIERPADQTTLTARYTERAVEFIESHRDEPFFLYLAHTMPHIPIFVADDLWVEDPEQAYARVMTELDRSVGQLLDALDETGLSQDTVFVFASDNGPWLSMKHHGGSAGGLRGGKFETWEGGMRVPCLMRWPGRIEAGSVTREVAATIDLLPTFARIAGAPLPDDRRIDGEDLGPVLEGGARDRAPFHFYRGERLEAVRDGRWKLHLSKGGEERLELYDLELDPAEKVNQADAHPDLVERLRADALRFDVSDGARDRPNIVLVLADDLGYGDPRCYNPDSRIETPSMDRLAAQGMRFVDAHSPSAVCSPTRYGILTGRYAWRTRLKKRVLWPWDGPLIEPGRLTMGSMLQDEGYATACIGKWHLGWTWHDERGSELDVNSAVPIGAGNPEQRRSWAERIDFSQPLAGGPIEHGFDEYFGDDVPNFPPYGWIENDRLLVVPDRPRPEGMFGAAGPMVDGWDLTAVMPELTRRAVQYIDGRRGKDEPFFLYMPLTAPHTPIAPSVEFAGKSAAGLYGDWVRQVDASLGEVMAALDRNGLAQDTLLVFTSDNGSPARDGTNMSGPTGSVQRFGHHPSGPLRGMKADIWEGGHRVPFIATWPGRVHGGTTSAEPIVLTDLMRTVAEIVGHELPENAAEDSYDIRSALRGEKPAKPIRDHMIHHSHHGVFAIREGDMKLILGKGSGGFTRFEPAEDAPAGQLYDLAADPGETRNLWRDKPAVVERLKQLLQDYQLAPRTHPHSGP